MPLIMMMRSDNENVGKGERCLTTAKDNDNHDNDDYNHDNDKDGYNHAIDHDDEEAIMKTLERQSGASLRREFRGEPNTELSSCLTSDTSCA